MSTALAPTLALWRPFLDPLNLHAYWWMFLIPLALGVSWTYRAVRLHDLSRFPRAVAIMTIQIVLAMIALGAASFIFVEYLIPLLAPMRH